MWDKSDALTFDLGQQSFVCEIWLMLVCYKSVQIFKTYYLYENCEKKVTIFILFDSSTFWMPEFSLFLDIF